MQVAAVVETELVMLEMVAVEMVPLLPTPQAGTEQLIQAAEAVAVEIQAQEALAVLELSF
jgi:hypothetical protein